MICSLFSILQKVRFRNVKPYILGRLLDVGCGTNDLVKLYGMGVGVDVYPWAGVDVLVEDASKLPFFDLEFDTVTIIATLNHIKNRYQTLVEIRRVLRKNGRLIITMIPEGLGTVWHKLRKRWDPDQNVRGMVCGERYGISKKELLALIKHAGFEIELSRRFMLGVNLMIVARKS